jgi:hypothetical protein
MTCVFRSPFFFGPRGVGLLVGLAVFAGGGAAQAQLRPLDPVDPWVLWERGPASAQVGVGVFAGQRASLAGAEGTLVELGNFAVRWRTGRVVLEGAGTAQRLFGDGPRFAEPTGGAGPAPDGRRHDTGDMRVSTLVRLTGEGAAAPLVLRFGTRLPTTDNRVGLDRDATDFFALAGGGLRHRRGWLAAEAGLGIHGTRDPAWEQSDVLLYSLSAGYRGARLSPTVSLVGHALGSRGRGNETLAELRIGGRAGTRRWVEVRGVLGLTPFSPAAGILLAAGWTP